MRVVSIVIAVTLAVPSAVSADLNEPTTFRGVPFGSSPAEAKAKVKDLSCSDQKPQAGIARSKCSGFFGVGDVSVMNLLDFADRKLVSVSLTFPADDFEFMAEVFEKKFGKPTTSATTTVKNKAGGEFEDVRMKWIGSSVTIDLERYGIDLNTSFANIVTKEWADQMNREHEAKLNEAVNAF